MKRGTHTIHMQLPRRRAPRGRHREPGAQPGNGGTEHIKRAIMLPRVTRPLDRRAPGVEDRDAVRERELLRRRELRRREPRELGDVVGRPRLTLADVALEGEVEVASPSCRRTCRGSRRGSARPCTRGRSPRAARARARPRASRPARGSHPGRPRDRRADRAHADRAARGRARSTTTPQAAGFGLR